MKKAKELLIKIASVAHEINRAYCLAQGDDSQPPWNEAPKWQKDSALSGVKFHLSGLRHPEDSHKNWMAEKEAEGWVYGEIKDPEAKTHPCMVPYDELPPEQKVKDYLFISSVHSAARLLSVNCPPTILPVAVQADPAVQSIPVEDPEETKKPAKKKPSKKKAAKKEADNEIPLSKIS